MLCPFNRTSMELKPDCLPTICPIVYPFNRTSMELKLITINLIKLITISFNRTSMELKRLWVVYSTRNKAFQALRRTASAHLVDPNPAIAPTGDDIVVVKRRVSAFSGSDLEVFLRARDIRHLILAGIATSGVVLSTIREAADKDYQLTVLSDLCVDFDAEVQSVLLEKVFPRQADVITSQQWISIQEKN